MLQGLPVSSLQSFLGGIGGDKGTSYRLGRRRDLIAGLVGIVLTAAFGRPNRPVDSRSSPDEAARLGLPGIALLQEAYGKRWTQPDAGRIAMPC